MSIQRMNVKVGSGASNIKPFKKTWTHQTILAALETKRLTPEIHAEVVKQLMRYPEGALPYAWTQIDSLISNVVSKMNPVYNEASPQEKPEIKKPLLTENDVEF